MKKAVCLLAALALMLCVSAYALRGSGYPAYDGGAAPDNTLAGNFGGQALTLSFDNSAEYSMVQNGVIQACFYAYSKDESHYIETYLEIPQSVQSGDKISSAADMRGLSSSASVSFYEVSKDAEEQYYAGSIIGIPYPADSFFEINIAEVKSGADALEVRGTLSATLLLLDEDNVPQQDKMQLDGIQFHFCLPVSGTAANPSPQEPETTPPEGGSKPAPAVKPAFTLPPDYITL